MLTIFMTSIKRKLKSPVVFVNYVLLPLLLIVILGNALSSVFQSTDDAKAAVNMKRAKTVVVNDDSGKLGKDIVQFLANDSNKEMFEVKVETDVNRAKKLLENDDYEQFIYLPKNLTDTFNAKKNSDVTIYGKDNNIDKVNITGLTLSAFGDGYLAMDVLSKKNQPILYSHVYNNLLTTGNVETKEEASENISALSYYGVTMLVLILFYGLANTMNFIQEEYDGALGDRYLVSPVSKTSLILGQLFTGLTISIIQGLLIVFCAKVFFKVSYGENLGVVLFIILAGAIFFNALGLILGVFGRRFKALDGIVTLLIPAMTFIGGGFIKLDFGSLGNISINEVFQRPLFNYIQQGVVNLAPIYSALALAMLFVFMSVFLLTRKGVR